MKFEKEKFLHTEYLNNLAQVNKNCVISGCEVTPAGGMQLNIAAGAVLFNGVKVDVPVQSVSLTAADATLNRADLIALDSTGTAVVLQGNYTSADEITAPISAYDYDPAQYVILARVNVWAGATEITADDIKDLRVFVHIIDRLADIPDVPDYASNANKILAVKADETGVEWVPKGVTLYEKDLTWLNPYFTYQLLRTLQDNGITLPSCFSMPSFPIEGVNGYGVINNEILVYNYDIRSKVVMYDDFEDGVIDTTKWSIHTDVDEPTLGQTAYVTEGSGYINATTYWSYSGPYSGSATAYFTSTQDIFQNSDEVFLFYYIYVSLDDEAEASASIGITDGTNSIGIDSINRASSSKGFAHLIKNGTTLTVKKWKNDGTQTENSYDISSFSSLKIRGFGYHLCGAYEYATTHTYLYYITSHELFETITYEEDFDSSNCEELIVAPILDRNTGATFSVSFDGGTTWDEVGFYGSRFLNPSSSAKLRAVLPYSTTYGYGGFKGFFKMKRQ